MATARAPVNLCPSPVMNPPMPNSAVLAAAMLSAAAASAAPPASVDDGNVDFNIRCDTGSQYRASMQGKAFVFEKTAGRDVRLVLGGGKLFIDGKPVALSPGDQQGIDAFEAELRQLVPESRKVVSEAVSIAIDALGEVSVALSGDEGRRAEYDRARSKALAAVRDSDALPIFDSGSIDGVIDPIVAEFVPDIAGSALGFAMKAMFAGEEKSKAMDARLQAMDKRLDTRVEARARALEPLAETVCKRIQRMEGIDAALTVRLPDGGPINFLDAETHD